MAVSPAFQNELDQTYSQLRAALANGKRDYEWRMEQLRALQLMIEENDDAISAAMWKDLRKSKFECTATEQGVVLSEIHLTLQKLRGWMKPRRVSTPLYNLPGRSYIQYDPLGLVLIIGAWNYPINLLLAPLVGAIAGGNGAILKPSEISANTAKVIGDLVPRYLDTKYFAVIQGAAEETSLLLEKKFDKIFFTGSGNVGKIVLAKAAPNLTPTTLELGGKSPAIVWKDADIKVTARRIAWGKFMNAGQTCVAPDYLFVHPEIRDDLIRELREAIIHFYGDRPSESPDYCRIVNEKNFDRLAGLLKGVTLLHGGHMVREKLFIEPTLVQATGTEPIMGEEIFGPILPLITMGKIEDVIGFINGHDKPLALYLFTKTSDIADLVCKETSSGAVCVNDNVIHMPVATLPFGGVGASGMGNYHGRFSFECFTHAKGVLRKSFWLDATFRYPPYTRQHARWLKWLFK